MFRGYLARVERRQIGGEDLACTARSILLFACCAENEESLGPLASFCSGRGRGRRDLGRLCHNRSVHLSRTNRLYECSWKFCRRRYFEYVLGSFVNAKGCTNYARNGVVCIRHTVHMERNTFAVMT